MAGTPENTNPEAAIYRVYDSGQEPKRWRVGKGTATQPHTMTRNGRPIAAYLKHSTAQRKADNLNTADSDARDGLRHRATSHQRPLDNYTPRTLTPAQQQRHNDYQGTP